MAWLSRYSLGILQKQILMFFYLTLVAYWPGTVQAQGFYQYTGIYRPATQQSAILTFYMHDNLDTRPSSAITVVHSAENVNGVYNNAMFGAIAVFDDPITLSSDVNSIEVGRGRGFYVFNSLDQSGSSLEIVWTAVFGPASGYSGSTLSFKGYDRIGDTQREIVITGGTGQFRMARGWAEIKTAAANGGAATLSFTAHVFYGV